MGTKLTGQNLKPTPVVGITDKVGGFFEGTLMNTGREVKIKRGKKMVYEFAIKDTDFPTILKNTDGIYGVVEVVEGDKVSVFAPTVLKSALSLAEVGQNIRIVYLGKAAGKNGEYHNFDVEVL